ncbi:hypothetical protein ACQ143_09775 [Microbacterium sp. MC2]
MFDEGAAETVAVNSLLSTEEVHMRSGPSTRVSGNRLISTRTGRTVGFVEDPPTAEELARTKRLRAEALAREEAEREERTAKAALEAKAQRRQEWRELRGGALGWVLGGVVVAGFFYMLWVYPIYGFDPSPLWTE